jgi:hypothetical protein
MSTQTRSLKHLTPDISHIRLMYTAEVNSEILSTLLESRTLQ